MADGGISVWQKTLTVALRIILGAIFIASGLAKSIDPWGTVFKVSEYLEVLNMMQPRTLIVFGTLILSWGEFLLGSLLLFGCYRRVTVWLISAVMAFMLPLSLWIMISNPVADCGCFGEAFIISNTATFVKNVAIVVMLIPLWMWNRRVKGVFTPYSQWLVGAVLTLFIGVISMLGYNIQPLVDFRRFKTGTSLISEQPSDDASVSYRFIYEKDGKQQEFDEDNLPDSTWTFVDRKILSGSEQTADSFVIINDEEDITSEIISDSGDQLLVVVTDMRRVNPSHTFAINELSRYLAEKDADIVTLIAGDENGLEYWQDISMTRDPVYTAEPTMLKELVRGNIAFVWLRDGKILWKRTMSSVDTDHFMENFDDYCAYPSNRLLYGIPTALALTLLLLFIADRTGLTIWLRHKRRTRLKKIAASNADKSSDNG